MSVSTPTDARPELLTLRATLEGLADPIPMADGVVVSEAHVGGVRCLDVSPSSLDRGAMLYVHGGAFCLLRADPYTKMAGHLARATSMPVLIPDYRLPPEHPYPVPVLDVLAAYVAWQGIQRTPVSPSVVAADSAGANLALAALRLARDLGLRLPDLVVLFSPWLDLTLSAESVTDNRGRDRELEPTSLAEYATAYAGAVPHDHPLISPRVIDRLPFPPVVIQAGADEILVDDARRLAQSAHDLGVEVSLDVAEGMQHNYQFWGPLVPRAMEAYAAIAERVEALRRA